MRPLGEEADLEIKNSREMRGSGVESQAEVRDMIFFLGDFVFRAKKPSKVINE